ADRADLTDGTAFEVKSIGDITPPCDTPGLVIANPPYGGRIGNKKPLFGLYASFGDRMRSHFKGWRVAIVTSDAGLAKATKLPFKPAGAEVNHGGIRIQLWQTAPL
ncbi:MAG: class I SAM-dependent RNA methyltransferase, partial [Octadecabacter sp.]